MTVLSPAATRRLFASSFRGHELRDSAGNHIGYIDDDAQTVRDVNGKVTATRAGKDTDALKLSDKAAAWMSGRSVLMDLSPGDVATAATVEDLGIPAIECIADRVSPVTFIKHDRGVFYGENIVDAVAPGLSSGGPVGSPPLLDAGWEPTPFTTNGYAFASRIPWEVVHNADFDVVERATWRLIQALRLSREVRVATLLTTAANFAAGNRVAATSKWDGGAGEDPLTDVFAALAASYLPANAIVLSENVAQYYFAKPNGDVYSRVRDFVQAGGQLPTPIVARAKVLSGGALKYVWSTGATTNVPLVRVVPDPKAIGTCRTFRWLGDAGVKDGDQREGLLVRTFVDKTTARGDTVVVALHSDYEAIVSNQVGSIITGALA